MAQAEWRGTHLQCAVLITAAAAPVPTTDFVGEGPVILCALGDEGNYRRGLKPLAEGIAIVVLAAAIIAALLFAARIWDIL
jgi:hypothetical protein